MGGFWGEILSIGQGGSAVEPMYKYYYVYHEIVWNRRVNSFNFLAISQPPPQGKEARQWDLANRDASSLDYSRKDSNKTLDYSRPANAPQARPDYLPAKEQVIDRR